MGAGGRDCCERIVICQGFVLSLPQKMPQKWFKKGAVFGARFRRQCAVDVGMWFLGAL